MSTIFIIEDSKPEAETLRKRILEHRRNVEVLVAHSTDEAKDIYRRRLGQVDLIVLDMDLRGTGDVQDGVNLMKDFRRMFIHVFPPAILVRTMYEKQVLDGIRSFLYDQCIPKGSGKSEDKRFLDGVDTLLNNQEAAAKDPDYVDPRCPLFAARGRGAGDGTPGWFRLPFLGSEQFRNSIMAEVEMLDREGSILLVGDNGTGKGMLARCIRANVPVRFNRPFVEIPVNSFGSGMIEAELYGVMEGTVAGSRARHGHIRAGDGGTVFLDEIGYLDVGQQGKLLRVVNDHAVVPMGVERSIKFDALVIAACQSDSEVGGTVAKALQARFPNKIKLRPLRERRDEIRGMMDFCRMAYYRHTVGLRAEIPQFDEAVSDYLEKAYWQGNIRRLIQVLGRTFSSTLDDAGAVVVHEIGVKELPEIFFEEELYAPGRAPSDPVSFASPPAPNGHAGPSAGPDAGHQHPAGSRRLRVVDPDDDAHRDRIHPNFFTNPPTKGYGLYQKYNAIFIRNALEMTPDKRGKTAEYLDISANRLRNLAEKYLPEDAFKRFFPRVGVAEPEGPDDGEGVGE